MRHLLPAALAFLLLGGAARAEVSVDRSTGSVEPFFEPGQRGPWDAVRTGVPPGDLLNPHGDSRADGWPMVLVNPALGRVEVTWASGGENAEILFASHDGTKWGEWLNLSEHPGMDQLPTSDSDADGNRFFAWQRTKNGRHCVVFTGLAGDAHCQLYDRELGSRPLSGRAPSLAVADDGHVYVAYEEVSTTMPGAPWIAIDRLRLPRYGDGTLLCGGEDTIDLARMATIRTHHSTSSAACEVEVRAESGHVWVTWIDEPGRLGFVELVNGSFGEPQYRSFPPGDEGPTRDSISVEVLSH